MNLIRREQFRWSAVFILLLTAAAKLLSATGKAGVLDLPDPLFGLANRDLLVWVGLIEVAVASALVLPIRPRLQFLGLAWLASNFLVYRIALAWRSPGKPCPCLGTWTERLHVSERTVSIVLSALVLYLLVGSVYSLRLPRQAARTV